MFDIMFMRQKQNETARLIWIAPKGPLSLGSNFKVLQLQLSRADAFYSVTRALNSAVRSSVKRFEFSDEQMTLILN